ncbi:LIM/homeobox protein Lhx9-like [Nylanderia fulva]|uniref:LIM/homeobox protein Lhx9-like n=1 Tax=Nylanderia fulva TaxID=613905 RepID=UPI0010FB3DB1|nr:LIM/homeobox protein Lhx9-like [Nylanderia fulva]
MNPHHPGHSAAYPHHPSLSSSPHHPGPGGPHHAYGTGGRGGGAGGGGTTTTPDLPSPHSPPHAGGAGDPATPYGVLQPGQGMGSNGHHHGGGGGMMPDHPHHPGHPHPHMPGHPAYPPVNHNNNCTLKQEGGPSRPTGLRLCAGCGVQIVERYLLFAMDQYWHIGCLKCTYCQVILGDVGGTCYTKSGMILCKTDYTRMFGGNGGICSSCGNTIPPNELVMRASESVFHLKCFNCNKCGNPLNPGDRYYLLSGSPVCESDWNKIVKSGVTAATAAAGNSGAPVRKGKVGRPRRSRE